MAIGNAIVIFLEINRNASGVTIRLVVDSKVDSSNLAAALFSFPLASPPLTLVCTFNARELSTQSAFRQQRGVPVPLCGSKAFHLKGCPLCPLKQGNFLNMTSYYSAISINKTMTINNPMAWHYMTLTLLSCFQVRPSRQRACPQAQNINWVHRWTRFQMLSNLCVLRSSLKV